MRIQGELPVAAYRRRAVRFALVALAICMILIGRLGYLQFVEGPTLKMVSSNNYVRTKRLPAQRGSILDRNGTTLAVHEPAFGLAFQPYLLKDDDIPTLITELKTIFDETEGGKNSSKKDAVRTIHYLDLVKQLKLPRGADRFRPVPFVVDGKRKILTRKQVAQIESLRATISGILVDHRYMRRYPQHEHKYEDEDDKPWKLGAHLLGYLGRPTAYEIRANPRYHVDSMLGRAGLERRLESELAGKDGFERYVVSASGRAQKPDVAWVKKAMEGIVPREDPKRGFDVELSIDAKIQRMLTSAMSGRDSGAAVVIEVQTGAVLGIVSKPTFDPNVWSGRLTRRRKQAIDNDPHKPMVDKSVQAYFPGSVYKIVTAFAAMDLGMLDPLELIESPGAYEFGNRTFHCHKRSGHGRINLARALSASADVYFYKLGEQIGIDRLAQYGRRFGFGRRTGLSINGESKGLMPTKAYHDETTPGGYQYGLALSTAVGQGDVRTTPLQVAVAYAALANGGRILKPYVVNRVIRSDGSIVREAKPTVVDTLADQADFLESINEGLRQAVHDEEFGTGHLAAVKDGLIGGKTGTAQVRKLGRGRNRHVIRHFRERDHAWFAAYAPYDVPKIAVVVFIEHGGSGGKQAAPVIRKILDQYNRNFTLFAQSETAQSDRNR
ncbi:MAG: penicillin-binding protein 2 [Myxococcales bacterium]|nr:penicillin-binding protein 2 [Myxococcales bacterium]